MIYLDNAATTYPKPNSVYEYVDYVNRNMAFNAGRGSYKSSRDAQALIDETRLLMAELMGSTPQSLILTPSATIALNQIVYGLEYGKFTNVYVSPFEHNALLRPLKLMQDRYGFRLFELPFSAKQELDGDRLKAMFAENKPDYVFAAKVSNVTGLILPVEEIFKAAKEYGALCVSDCAQAAGLVDLGLENTDFAVFAAHKTLYGVFGCGGYINNSGTELKTVLAGGTGSDSLNLNMPDDVWAKYEPASKDIGAIAGLNAALKWMKAEGKEKIRARELELTRYLRERLGEVYGLELYVPEDTDRHVAIVSFNKSGYLADELAEILDADFGIALRSGYHCAALVHGLLGTEEYRGTVRAGISYFTSEAEIDSLAEALEEL